jgi:hypothetical protein
MPGTRYTAQELAQIETRLREAEQQQNLSAFVEAIYDIWLTTQRINLHEFEYVLRKIQSNAFLIAVPYTFDPLVVPKLPGEETEYEYVLGISIEGPDNVADDLEILGVDFVTNLAHLTMTGLLTSRADQYEVQE